MTGTDKILAICICTDDAPAARPRLQHCLASALGQDPGAGMRLVVILVDNSETGTAAGCDPAIRYVHEPIRGIPFARNAGLEEAINLRADLIGFIDADELAPLGWVALLRAELEASGADVVQGDVRRFSDDASLHAFCSAPVAPVTRRRSAATGATNNTLMRAWIVDAAACGSTLRCGSPADQMASFSCAPAMQAPSSCVCAAQLSAKSGRPNAQAIPPHSRAVAAWAPTAATATSRTAQWPWRSPASRCAAAGAF
jgi:hypothetical protein